MSDSDPVYFAEGDIIKVFGRLLYRRLDSTSFRLLKLHPKSSRIDVHQNPQKDGYLQGTLVEHKLGDDLSYDCLSYVWGSPEATTIIFLDGGALPLTANLELALKSVQQDDLDRLIWVDAICINQQDQEERRLQVQIMRTIFSGAKRVVAFLGPDADGSETMPAILKRIKEGCERFEIIVPFDIIEQSNNRIHNLEEVGLPRKDDDLWRKVTAFLSRPWFVRVWIIQEAVVARDLQFTCGSWSLDGPEVLETLVMAFEHGLPIHEDFRSVLANNAPAADAAQQIYLMLELGMHGMPLSRMSSRTQKWGILDILTRSKSAKATEVRDYLFAVLGLSAEQSQPELQPDYTASVEENYSRYARYFVQNGQGAQILYSGHGTRSLLNLPSWVPDWSLPRLPFTQLAPEKFRRGAGQTAYVNAGGHSGEMSLDSSRDRLIVKGYLIDVVERVGKLFTLRDSNFEPQHLDRIELDTHIEVISNSIAEMAQFLGLHNVSSVELQEKLEAVWRTAIWNRRVNQQVEAPSEYWTLFNVFRMASTYYMASEQERNGVALDNLISEIYPDQEVQAITDEFRASALETILSGGTQYVHAATASCLQTLSCLTKKGHLGKVPIRAQTGDVICVIAGAAVPFLLRPKDDGYMLVGQCYLHGFMKGEVLEMGEYRAEEILLL